jgi:hypothetical protein
MAEIAVSRHRFHDMLRLITELRRRRTMMGMNRLVLSATSIRATLGLD